jgi:predicted nucleotidyltransferase
MPQHPFEAARAATVAALTRLAEGDPRIEALWLQGSLAAGDADPFSDIDAYLAVRDADYDAVWADREGVLSQLGGALAWSNATTPGLGAVHALLTGGVRLDLFFEKASAAGAAPRPAVKVLVDKAGVGEHLRLGWSADPHVVVRIITTIIRMTRQGATWPLRVLGRGQWATLAMMELDLINAQVAQLMAVTHDPANFYRNSFSLAQVLTDAERARLAGLTDATLAALTTRDLMALKAVHLSIFDALVETGRAACAALATPYPIDAASERAVRALIETSWPAS